MTNLETNLLKVLTCGAVCFLVGPYGFLRPSYETFINRFAIKTLAGPYGSYDNIYYLVQYKVILTFESVDQIFWCDHSTETGIFCEFLFWH